MHVTYDRSADAAYIRLVASTKPGQVKKTYPCNPVEMNGAQINLNFDANWKLLGIEVLDASKHLTKELLSEAKIIG